MAKVLQLRNTQLRRHINGDAAITSATLRQLPELRTDRWLELEWVDTGPALLLTLSCLRGQTEIF